MSTRTPLQTRPAEIKRHGRDSVEIRWDDGHLSLYPNRYLRDRCPCAACREDSSYRIALPVVGGTQVYPLNIGVVGRYAISIAWSDQHDSGIYSYDTLRTLCTCDTCQNEALPA